MLFLPSCWLFDQPRCFSSTDCVCVALIARSLSNDLIRGARTRDIRDAKKSHLHAQKQPRGVHKQRAAAGHSTMQLSHMLMRYDNSMGDPQPSSRKVSKKIFLHAATACNGFIFIFLHTHLYLSVRACSVCTHKGRALLSYARARCSARFCVYD
jgi:hypothetical protein